MNRVTSADSKQDDEISTLVVFFPMPILQYVNGEQHVFVEFYAPCEWWLPLVTLLSGVESLSLT